MTEQAASTAAPQSRHRKNRYGLLLAAVVVLGLLAWRMLLVPPDTSDIVELSGRIEGDDAILASRTNGRIVEIRVREGDRVKAGDTVAVLEDEQVKAHEQQARAAITVSEAQEVAARRQLATLYEQLQQTKLQTGQSRTDAEGRVRQAESQVAGSEAELVRQEASLKLALYDQKTYADLAESGVVPERRSKEATAFAEQQTAMVVAAKRHVDAARGALTTARANLDTPDIRASQEAVVRTQIAHQESEIAVAVARTNQARFTLAEAEARVRDLTVTAPFDGTVVTRSSEPGEVVTAGTAILTIVDLNKVYLRGFVPEEQIGRIGLGRPARVYLDSNPDQPIEAVVSRTDPEAAFTPENTYFREDRVKQVIGIKLQLKAGFGLARPGMAADGEILVSGDQWPERRRPQ